MINSLMCYMLLLTRKFESLKKFLYKLKNAFHHGAAIMHILHVTAI